MNIALVLSGGVGTRMGEGTPKQYRKVCGMSVLSYCLQTLCFHDRIDAVQIVADAAWQDFIGRELYCFCRTGEERRDAFIRPGKFRGFSEPGKNRQLSVLNGLTDIYSYAADTDYVLVCDGARPMLSKELVSACLDNALGHDGALPVLPMKDTVYESRDGKTVSALLDRKAVVAGQAPEAFLLGAYYEANRRLLPDRILQINGSAEPAVLAGMDIAVFGGEEENFKITGPADMERFIQIMEKRREACNDL